ncbi:hypothetical protein BpHYR1_044732 [Brachionus plicatilis]|uniref:Uncharacterized protein n=1 Tax=Brachionus plicatilis TaxID=10195 RepID=A0A3M7Q886_BRAPC|nr:hypothetical protein BpHYR1_044732 [Brachionus plicatilis]
MDLSKFLEKNELPCFCEVSIVDLDGSIVEDEKEKLYLYRQFENDCILAKCYSNVLQSFLLQQRPSFIPSDPNLTLSTNQSSGVEYLFSEIVSIPVKYHVAIEWYCEYRYPDIRSPSSILELLIGITLKLIFFWEYSILIFFFLYGTLHDFAFNSYNMKITAKVNHFEDNLSLQSKIEFFVNELLRLFEILSSNSQQDHEILDHETDVASLTSRLHKPRVYYVNREMNAYEISPVSSTDEETNTMRRRWLKVPKGSIIKLMKVVSIDYEESGSIISKIKKFFCCNSKTIRTDIAIELKILENFDDFFKMNDNDCENLMKHKKNSMLQTRARLSVADIRVKASFLPVYENNGYNEEIDLIPISFFVKNHKIKIHSLQLAQNFALEKIDQKLIELKLFEENIFKPTKASLNNFNNSDMLQESQHLEIEKYMSIYDLINYRSKCSIIAAYSFKWLKIKFNLLIEGLRMDEIKHFLVKPKHQQKHEKNNLADSVKADDSIFTFNDEKFIRNESSSSSALFLKADKSRSSTFPKEKDKQKSEDETLKNGDLKEIPSPQSFDKIGSRFKRTSRAFSLPVDQALLIKEYMNILFTQIINDK